MPEPKVIYEDENFIAVDKPAGMLVHSLANSKLQMANRENTLVDWLLRRYPEIKSVGDDPKTRPGIVHRLDKDTSGILLVARNQKYFNYLKSLFQNRLIEKVYLAVVRGLVEPKMGIIEKPISLKSGSVKRTVWRGKMEKAAVTEYKVKKYLQDKTLLEVMPKTGRTHQIRVHLASVGHPIVGDKIYGRKDGNSPRLMLHALSLKFPAAEGKAIKLEAEPPREWRI